MNISDLILKWAQLDTEISLLHKQGLQHQLSQQILSIRKKLLELKTIILAVNIDGNISLNRNKVQHIKDQLEAEKESLWLVNFDVHIHLAQQPSTAIILLEDVASLYQLWEQLVTKIFAIDTLLEDAKKSLSKFKEQLGNLKCEISAHHEIRVKSFINSPAARHPEVTLESFISKTDLILINEMWLFVLIFCIMVVGSEWMENWNNMQLIGIIFAFLFSFWIIKTLFL